MRATERLYELWNLPPSGVERVQIKICSLNPNELENWAQSSLKASFNIARYVNLDFIW